MPPLAGCFQRLSAWPHLARPSACSAARTCRYDADPEHGYEAHERRMATFLSDHEL